MSNPLNIPIQFELLKQILSESELTPTEIKLIGRKTNPYSDTFPTEIITLKLDGKKTIKLFCKYYDGKMQRDLGHGHRGGLAYETAIYKYILQKFPRNKITLPHYIASYIVPETAAVILILEMIENAAPVHKHKNWVKRMENAVRWLGQFNRINNVKINEDDKKFLIQYSQEYYSAWLNRTRLFTSSYLSGYPRIKDACDIFEEGIEVLIKAPQQIIHGKYNPKELLVSNGAIYPVDWESAALGVAEIDLAMFLFGWDNEHIPQWIKSYKEARWPFNEGSNDFEKLFYFSQLYVQMRWLGDRQHITSKMLKKPEVVNNLKILIEKHQFFT